jgi:hypothetical protein
MVARLPGLAEHIGWVKAPSYRLASRAVNVLRAGIAVQTYEDLDPASLILVSVPREIEDGTIKELAEARLDWRARAVVVLNTPKTSGDLRLLLDVRAQPATLHPVGGGEERTFILEGHQDTVRLMQKSVSAAAVRSIQVITTGGKARALAGIEEATRGFLPLIASVTDHFKASGLSKAQSEVLAQSLVTGSMRSYFRAGRRALDFSDTE